MNGIIASREFAAGFLSMGLFIVVFVLVTVTATS